jgi:predicted RND superfamily exporter protein
VRWDVALRSKLESLFGRWGHFAARHPWPPIVGLVMLASALAVQLPQLQIETSVENFLRKGHPARVAYEDFRDRFGRDEYVVLALEPPKIFDLGFLADLRALHKARFLTSRTSRA